MPSFPKQRIRQIRAQIQDAGSDFDREKMQERLAKLVGGVAVIKVGGVTEVEVREKKFRIEDALSATRAAVEEGVVPGGGVAFIRAQSAIDAVIESLSGDEKTGAVLVQRARQSWEPISTHINFVNWYRIVTKIFHILCTIVPR